MKFLVLALVLVVVAAAVLTMSSEPHGQPAEPDVARLIYLLLWLVLAAGGVMGVRQQQREETTGKGPGVFMSLAIWAGVLALLVLLYRGAWFWNGIASLFAGAAPR